MAGLVVKLLCRGYLDNSTQVHHRNSITDVLDNAEVVGDEEVSQAEFFLQVFQQVDDLRLDGEIEC